MIPYADITTTADRRWTARLLDRLSAPDLPVSERNDLVEALQAVSDPRSFAPLEEILRDRARPAWVREAAGSALRGLHHIALDVPAEQLRRWWRQGDPVLARHALLWMDGLCCPDIVLRVAGDPTHPWQADALGCMDWWFDRPEHEAVKIAGLSHPDPKVRAAAACVLLWDEPVAAEGPLIGGTLDAVAAVVIEAANTLRYYPTCRTVRSLHALLDHGDAKVRRQAEESLAEIRGDLLGSLCGGDRRVASRVRGWLDTVWGLLAFTDDELRPDEELPRAPAAGGPATDRLALSVVLDLLADPDTSPLVLQEQLGGNDWARYEPAERVRLRGVLLAHPDPVVREQAARGLAAWRDVSGLIALAEDANYNVRKTALYYLGTMPATPGVAELAWTHLLRRDTVGVHATETLTTFARQAPPGVAVPRLERIASDDGQWESLRVTAVEELTRLGAAGRLVGLLQLLRQPPAVTWALHIALLEAVDRLGLPKPDVRHLRGVDHLYLQEAVARVDL
jgi:HEAT repeat protein